MGSMFEVEGGIAVVVGRGGERGDTKQGLERKEEAKRRVESVE